MITFEKEKAKFSSCERKLVYSSKNSQHIHNEMTYVLNLKYYCEHLHIKLMLMSTCNLQCVYYQAYHCLREVLE